MNSDLEKLREIGAQKIYEQTHITKEHVQAILHKSFEGLNKVQFLGFTSIIEREYDVDLKEVREAATIFYEQQDSSIEAKKEHKGIFVTSNKDKKNNTPYIVVIILIILATTLYLKYNRTFTSDVKVDDSLIKSVQKDIDKDDKKIVKSEQNTTTEAVEVLEVNTTIENEDIDENTKEVVEEVVENVVEEKASVNSLKIVPKTKLWIGYIEISTNKHHQIITKAPLSLDPNNDWLILLAHNKAEMDVDGKITNVDNNLRFLYQDYQLKPITTNEFKALNKGKKW